ncbi:MAG TPA: hypothetical protein VHG28_20835 [Longimicrobiaceae bacterium]|nr:hypothetical protein [Longimicrobiaceae bacterium]
MVAWFEKVQSDQLLLLEGESCCLADRLVQEFLSPADKIQYLT